MNARISFFPFLIPLIPLASSAQSRYPGPHVHGQASVKNMSVNGRKVDVGLRLQGIDTLTLYHPLTLQGVRHSEAIENSMTASAYGMSDASLVPYRDSDSDRLSEAFQ